MQVLIVQFYHFWAPLNFNYAILLFEGIIGQ